LARRHFNTQSCSRRVLFYATRGRSPLPLEKCFYSAKIHKDGALGPAIRRPPISIPFEKISRSTTAVLNDKISLRIGSQTHIYSPDTGEYSTLPDYPPLDFKDYCRYYSYLGVDTLSNEYKVLLLQTVGPVKYTWVFTPASGSWRRIIEPRVPHGYTLDFLDEDDNNKVVFANGAINFFSCDGAHDDPAGKYILAFDMKEEQFRKIPLPYDSDSVSGYLIQTCGHLAFIEDMWKKRWEGSSDDKLKLWILEDDKWVYKPIHCPFRFWFVYSSLLAFNYITGEMLLQFHDTPIFLYCNTKTGTSREVLVSGFPHGNGSKHDYFGFRVIDVKFG
jgi:F-box interacting protein